MTRLCSIWAFASRDKSSRKEKLRRQWKPLSTLIKEKYHFGTKYHKTPLPADKKGPVREVQQSNKRWKKSQRDWSTSLKQARAPGTDIAELS